MWCKGAYRKGAPFALKGRRFTAAALLLCLLAPLGAPRAAQPGATCTADRIDQRAVVAYVYDGDTVRLGDGHKVRLIGIDTPEIGHHGRPTQPGAIEAREALRRLLGKEGRLALRYGAERRDHYGRLLAHVYLPDGSSLTRRLLEAGLGTHLTIPPNLRNNACYGEAEAKARRERGGIWALPGYRPAESTALPDSARGFHIVRGKVVHIGESRSAVWVDLAGRVGLRIPRKDLRYFTAYHPRDLAGQEVLARGWLHARHGELRMTVRHPDALRRLGP